MKKIGILLICLIMAVMMAGCGKTETKKEAGPKKFQIGHVLSANAEDPYQVLALNFADNVKEMSGGKIDISVVPGAQLGGERDMIEGMQLGTIHMAIVGNISISAFNPQNSVFDLPFIFTSAEKAHKVLDGPAGTKTLNSLDKLGIKGLAWGEGGFRHMINKVRPIVNPADIKGLNLESWKVRCISIPIKHWERIQRRWPGPKYSPVCSKEQLTVWTSPLRLFIRIASLKPLNSFL